jgi:hypothetical protein
MTPRDHQPLAYEAGVIHYIRTMLKDYLTRVMDLGFEDARRQHDQICSFLEASSAV